MFARAAAGLAGLFNGTNLSNTWPGGQATLEVEAKILAGDAARAGRVVDSALHACRRHVFGRSGFARRETRRHRTPDGAVFESALSGRPRRITASCAACAVVNPYQFFSPVPAVPLRFSLRVRVRAGTRRESSRTG